MIRSSRALLVAIVVLVGTAWAPGAGAEASKRVNLAVAPGDLVAEQALRSWQVIDLQPAEESTLPDWDVLVWDFAEINGVMYVGGRFQTVRKYSGATEHDQAFLAAFDVNTGEWVSTFRPQLDDGVYALAASPDGSRLLVGGEFSNVNGQPLTSGFVALDPFTGEPDPSWKASVTEELEDVSVHEIVVDPVGDHVYIAGNFSHVESSVANSRTRRYNIARLNGSTGALDRDWNLTAGGGRVLAMALSPDGAELYVGGFFTALGQTENTKWAAMARTVDASVTPLATPLPANLKSFVFDIVATETRVFFATERHRLWVYDRGDRSSIATYWTHGHGGDPQALLDDGNVVWMGGHHHGYVIDLEGDGTRYQTQWLSAVDRENGRPLTGWTARLGMKDGIFALARDSKGQLWVGGDPTSSGTVPVRGFAVFPPRADENEVNVARGRIARQSSVGDAGIADGGKGEPEKRCDDEVNDLVGPAAQAVDGKIGGGVYECSYSATALEASPWWQIDLGSEREVDAVRIWNLHGTDRSADLADVRLAVSNDFGAIDSTDLAALEADPAVDVQTIDGEIGWVHEVPVGVRGRYVRIFMNPDEPTQLRLAEVEVLDLPGITPQREQDDSMLIEEASTWFYTDTAEAPPQDWASRTFDAGAWTAGVAPLGFGDDDLATLTNSGIPTTYFRHNFDLADPAAVKGLSLDLMADDGAIVFMNGVEVFRLRMPAGPVDHAAGSAETVWGAAERAWTTVALPVDDLVAGLNTLAVEVHNNWYGGGDLRFDAALNRVGDEVEPPLVDQLLIPEDAEWRYLDTGVYPGDQWTALPFDDASWGLGRGQFGYGDGDEVTVVEEGPVPDRHITHWFRTRFDLTDPEDIASLDVSLLRDDGAVVYVNGVEIVRSNMPDGVIDDNTPASTYAWGIGESVYHRSAARASVLVEGTNVVAVEVHSADSGSSDLSFGLKLVGVAP